MSSDVAKTTAAPHECPDRPDVALSIPDGLVTTSITDQIVRLAASLGLRPQFRSPYRGTVEIHVNGPDWQSVFGTILIGARSGRVLRATLRYGTDGETRKCEGAVAVRRALLDLRP